MRWSDTLAPVLRQSPAEAAARSHALMLRAGLVRRFAGGSCACLPRGAHLPRETPALLGRESRPAGELNGAVKVWLRQLSSGGCDG